MNVPKEGRREGPMYMYLISSQVPFSVSTYLIQVLPRYIIVHVGCTVGTLCFSKSFPFLPFPFLFWSVDKVYLPATYVRYIRYLFLLFLQVVLSL